jgi:hypothetical protein
VFGCAIVALAPGADSRKPDEIVTLPPVVVENSPLRMPPGSRWKEELVAPGAIWKLDDAKRTQSFLFDEGALVRTVFGTKGVMHEDGSITAAFRPMRLRWRLENEWLVFVDEQNRRIEELKFVRDGLLWLSAARRSGEIVKFRITKAATPKPIKIIKP